MAENGKVMLDMFKQLVDSVDKFKNQVVPMDKFLQEMQWTKDNVGAQVAKLMQEFNDLKAANDNLKNENAMLVFQRQDESKKADEESRKKLIAINSEHARLNAKNEQLKKEIYSNEKKLEEIMTNVKETKSAVKG